MISDANTNLGTGMTGKILCWIQTSCKIGDIILMFRLVSYSPCYPCKISQTPGILLDAKSPDEWGSATWRVPHTATRHGFID